MFTDKEAAPDRMKNHRRHSVREMFLTSKLTAQEWVFLRKVGSG
jgi:hypothetical protein